MGVVDGWNEHFHISCMDSKPAAGDRRYRAVPFLEGNGIQ